MYGVRLLAYFSSKIEMALQLFRMLNKYFHSKKKSALELIDQMQELHRSTVKTKIEHNENGDINNPCSFMLRRTH